MRVPHSLRASVLSRSISISTSAPIARPVLAASSNSAILPSSAFPSSSRGFSTTFPALKKAGKGGKADKPAKGGKVAKGKADKGGKGDKEEEGLSPEEIDQIVEKTKQRMDKAAEWARMVVFDGVERGRGRVTPALIDHVKVPNTAGALVPINKIASITTKQSSLILEVWEPDMAKHVESALHKANLPGLSPVRDGITIRIPVPRPTGDVRASIARSFAETVETAKNQIRTARTDGLKALGGRGKDGTEEVQDMTEKMGEELEKLVVQAKKELEKA